MRRGSRSVATSRSGMLLAPVCVLIAMALWLPVTAAGQLAVHVFARVPAPGYPASTVLAANGTVYTGTFKSFTAPSPSGPSKVFAFSPSGTLLRTYTVTGQTAGEADAVQLATRDRSGTLYLLDQSPARVLTLDPQTGQQRTWATFASLPACSSVAAGVPCSDGEGGQPPEPDFATWGPDGSLYVTDYNQALIWRIPPGGGKAIPWLTTSDLNGIVVGPAGIELMPGGHSLMISNGGNVSGLAAGQLLTVPIEPDGDPGPLHQIWQSAPGQAPDGLAIARSGDIYVSLVGPTGNAVEEVSPSGREIAEVPSSAAANELMSPPFDAPGSVTFDGDNIIVTNEASLDNDSANWALLEIAVGEPGLAPSLPPAGASSPRARLRYVLRVTPQRARAGRAIRFRFLAVRTRAGRPSPLAHALITFAGHHVRTRRSGRAHLVLRLRRPGRYRARLRAAGKRRATSVVVIRRR